MSNAVRDSSIADSASPEALLIAAARAGEAAEARIAAAIADLFAPAHARLSDAQRVAIGRLLGGLVEAMEDGLRARLIPLLDGLAPETLLASLGNAQVPIAAPILDRAQLLRDADLVAILLRRADEHRLSLRLADARSGSSLTDRLIETHDGPIAEAVVALMVAESRRLDRFADPVIARTDLPAEVQHRLAWRVAAALREAMLTHHGLDPLVADRAIVSAVSAVLAGYDEGDTLEGRAIGLAVALRSAGLLDDALLADALASGHVALFVAGVGLRTAIEPGQVWAMIADGDNSRILIALRSLGMDRDIAADILLRLSADEPGERLAARIDSYEAITVDQARAAIAPWRLDADYRRAIAGLAAGAAR